MAIRRVLIANDAISVVRELEARLAGLGHDVVAIASTGREAITLAAQTEPDVVLMDLALGGDLDAVKAATEIRQRWRIPVIFMTAETDDATLRRARVTDPYGYVAKPFTPEELISAVKRFA